MSDIQVDQEPCISGVDIENCGNSLRVASNTPHLISLGCGRLSTAVTIHPLVQGGITLGSDSSNDIFIQGTGVYPKHCRIENSNGVVTLYPVTGTTTIDGIEVNTPTRLSQGCMIGIGRSNYLRFNHPEEANLMKSVLPNTRISMAPIQFLPNENYDLPHQKQNNLQTQGYPKQDSNQTKPNQCSEIDKYEKLKNSLSATAVASNRGQSALDSELEMISEKLGKKKPPIAPRRMFRDLDQVSNSSSSDQEVASQKTDAPPKTNSIMAKVSKFEFYVKNSQRNLNKSVPNNEVWSPKVFTSNSLTGNIPAKDVLIGKNTPSYPNKTTVPDRGNNCNGQRAVILNENNAIEAKNCSYMNVTIKSPVSRIDEITKSFDKNRVNSNENTNKSNFKIQTPSPCFNRNPIFKIPNGNNEITSEYSYQNNSGSYNMKQETFIDENQKLLDQARIDEILTMCAEYEKQNSIGVPTTPTEKKTHNKIITNGSLPRSFQNCANIVQTSDGCFKFDTGKHKFSGSPLNIHSPNSPKFFTVNQLSPTCEHENNQVNSGSLKSPNSSIPNIQIPNSNNEAFNVPQNTRQFPITELSSPVMIRKIARNAQNASNYVSNYERNLTYNHQNNFASNDKQKVFSPYENVVIQIQGSQQMPNSHIPKSPNTSSPRTRIRTTYSNRNATQPQHFIFPSPSSDKRNNQMCSIGIERQLSLTEDIPMIDDTDFANELETRIARLKPENREKTTDDNDFMLETLENLCINRRNFDEIKRDLIADIPEFDAIHRDIDQNISKGTPENLTLNKNKPLSSNNLYSENNITERKNMSDIITTKKEKNKETILEINKIDDSNHLDNVIDSNDEVKTLVSISEECIVDEMNSNMTESKSENIENACIDELVPNTILKNESDKAIEEIVSDSILCTNSGENEEKCLSTKEAESKLSEDKTVNENNESLYELENLYAKRRKIMDNMKEIKTEINDIEMSRKQSQLELDEFEIRIESLHDGLQVQWDIRRDEIEMVKVSDCEKLKFKQAQEERQAEMKAMQLKLEQADEHVKKLEKDFSRGIATLEELRHAQEILENEKKVFEDMEFQHLEKESEFYSRIAKEQNILKNDPWGTCKKIEKMEKLLDELNYEITQSEYHIDEKYGCENPQLKKLLEDLSQLENDLFLVNEDINRIKKESGIFRKSEKNTDLENYKARIKSGDFSPPTSDEDDMNEIKDRVRLSKKVEENSKNGQSDLFEKSTKNKNKNPIDQMSMSMIVQTNYSLQDLCEISDEADTSKDIESEVNGKKDLWERNFDSLNRLKNKDKKNKNQDIMSQSLNENMFYNNENIESDYSSFEKCNSLKRESRANNNSKQKPMDSSDDALSISNSAKIYRDSLTKKNNLSKNVIDDKENIDINIETAAKSTDNVSKNGKHRYLKNSRAATTDNNKYINKSSKIGHNNSLDGKMSKENVHANNSLEEIDGPENLLPSKHKIMFRKSAGDEIKKLYEKPEERFCENVKIPSQDDIDRISKVTLDAPLFSNNGDLNTLGRKTLDSLRELQRNRVAMLEQKGCEVIESEREKMMELKKRVQNETLLKWEENQLKSSKNDVKIVDNDLYVSSLTNGNIRSETNNSSSVIVNGTSFMSSSPAEDSTNDSSIDKYRNPHSDPYNLSSFSEDGTNLFRNDQQSSPVSNNQLGYIPEDTSIRPLSEMSDMSSDNGVYPQPLVEGPRRGRKASSNSLNNSFIRNREDIQRPLTRYLPIDRDDFNLRQHIESAGHQVDLCPHIIIDSTSCRGYLHKLGAKLHGWSKRWFVFDRMSRTLVYYSDKNEKKPRGGAYFQVIEEVYLDHLNASKSPSPLNTFVIKTRQRRYYLMAPSGPAARIWIDVIFTGAQGYTEYLQ